MTAEALTAETMAGSRLEPLTAALPATVLPAGSSTALEGATR